jgi:hypothetical protein
MGQDTYSDVGVSVVLPLEYQYCSLILRLVEEFGAHDWNSPFYCYLQRADLGDNEITEVTDDYSQYSENGTGDNDDKQVDDRDLSQPGPTIRRRPERDFNSLANASTTRRRHEPRTV